MSTDQQEAMAADWLSREDRGLSAEETVQLAHWLDETTLNRIAYLRLKAVWRRADRLSALKSPAAPQPVPTRGWMRPALYSALAACLMVAVGAGVWFTWLKPPAQVYATAIGKTQAVRLGDGTRMELNTDTKVHAEVNARRRVVTLDSGEVYFDVVHDDSRPFTVYAGNRRITDLGTKFAVYRNGDDVRVTVREGRVKVDMLNHPALDAPLVAEAGHMVVTKDGEALLLAKPLDDIANDLSWRSGLLVFNQQTLADAADQFNRYNSRKISIEGSARKIRIGGSFRADNVDVFVLLLHRGFGLSVNDQGNRIVVSR
jgi:transmembrane sensor